MRERIKNNISVQLEGYSMEGCTNIKIYVQQDEKEFELPGTLDAADPTIVHAVMTKAQSMELRRGWGKIQIALTPPSGEPWASDDADIDIGRLIWRAGYGN